MRSVAAERFWIRKGNWLLEQAPALGRALGPANDTRTASTSIALVRFIKPQKTVVGFTSGATLSRSLMVPITQASHPR